LLGCKLEDIISSGKTGFVENILAAIKKIPPPSERWTSLYKL
jgi:hypothetical protein